MVMAVLSSIFSMTRASTAMASLNNDSPIPSSSSSSTKPSKKATRTRIKIGEQNLKLRKKRLDKPSIAKIERALGAGSYRDSESEEMNQSTVFDELLLGHANQFESKVEKKLREIGEVFVEKTETNFRSSGKPVLMFAMQWILPIWTLSLLIACGVIKLPFSLPFLEDLIM